MVPLSRAMRALLLSTCLVAPAMTVPAQAAEISAAQATVLEGQLKQWLAGFLWVGASLPSRVVELTPQGDHYAARIPLGTMAGGKDSVDLTADVTPGDDGRWNVRNFQFPSPATFSLNVPSGEASDGKPATTPVTYTVKVAEQNAGGTFDPSYATPTTFSSSYRALTVQADIGGKPSLSQIARSDSTSTLTPAAAPGRVNQTVTGTMEGYSSTSTLPDGTPLTVAFDKIGVTGEILGVSRDKAAEVSRNLFTLIMALQKAKGTDGAPDPSQMDKAPLRGLLAAMRDFADSGKVVETLEGIKLNVGGSGGGLSRATFGFSTASANGIALVGMDLGMEGLTVANLPLGPYEALIPRRVALRPTVTGVATSDLMDLAQAALDEDSAKMNGMIGAIFGHGGVVVGLENLVLDVAGTSFTGQGKVTVPDPTQASGSGQLVATNFDALMNQLKTLPQAQQVLPALLFAKGIGQSSGDKITWNISYNGGSLLVNGTDVMAMMGGGASRPASPPPPTVVVPAPTPKR